MYCTDVFIMGGKREVRWGIKRLLTVAAGVMLKFVCVFWFCSVAASAAESQTNKTYILIFYFTF